MSSTKYVIVYNGGVDSLAISDDGQSIEPRTWRAAQRSKVQEHIASGALVVTDPDSIDDTMSNPVAIRAKEEYTRLTAEWEKEKADEESATKMTNEDPNDKGRSGSKRR